MTWQGAPGREDLCSWLGRAAVNSVTSRRSGASGGLCLLGRGVGGPGEGWGGPAFVLRFPESQMTLDVARDHCRCGRWLGGRPAAARPGEKAKEGRRG